MDTTLIVLVSLLVGGFALAFYMDWLGLWVSKDELRDEVMRAKERRESQERAGGSEGPTVGTAPRQALRP